MDNSDHPLYVAFLWHFHQPFYKDLATGEYWLPWVRLHGIKDYYQMANMASAFPDLRLNFNFVPSLLEQLEDYAEGTAIDRALELTLKPAQDLTPSEEISILAHFFSANWETMIEPYPRYRELLEKRGKGQDAGEWAEVRRFFSPQDFLDLQVWFNLTWFHSALREADPFLRDLVRRGRSFSEEEKLLLLEKQREVIAQVVPRYRGLLAEGRIEISASPYYHPILPLLCDTEVARESSPEIPLPKNRFRHPEDARAQIHAALESHLNHFRHPAQGMWPSEGAVSQEMAGLVARAGIKWIASDEEILFRSLGLPLPRGDQAREYDPRILYQPYLLRVSDLGLALLFRDHYLSDLIGFTYARWEPKLAAQDLLGQIQRIRNRLRTYENEGPFMVTIILDGENAWEYYQDDGRDFLSFLYEGLTRGEGLQTVKISDFLEGFPPQRQIAKLASGSWINHNFRIWIGHEEDNAAWDLLAQTRNDLTAFEHTREGESEAAEGKGGVTQSEKAWKGLYIAEGSDWCWWYGDDHTSGMDEEFDGLFRKHLMNVYAFMGAEVPDRLYVPLLGRKEKASLTLEWADLIHPSIDGRLTNYFEWLPAGFYNPTKAGDAMHLAHPAIKAIYAGFDYESMFLRIDVEEDLLKGGSAGGLSIQVHFLAPSLVRMEAELGPTDRHCAARLCEVRSTPEERNSRERTVIEGVKVAVDRVVEVAMPVKALRIEAGGEVRFIVVLSMDRREKERWPRTSYFTVRVPCPRLLSDFWQA